jgi:hypothetical protein
MAAPALSICPGLLHALARLLYASCGTSGTSFGSATHVHANIATIHHRPVGLPGVLFRRQPLHQRRMRHPHLVIGGAVRARCRKGPLEGRRAWGLEGPPGGR